jgi:hypothetical protein
MPVYSYKFSGREVLGANSGSVVIPGTLRVSGSTAPSVGFVNVTGTPSAGPTLGSGTVGSQALLASNGLYGMYSGVSNSGDVWHQVQRNDANGTPYGILLNPNGGGVAIGKGTTTPAHALDVTGTGNATSDFRAPIFYDSNSTSYYVDPASTSRLFTLEVFNRVGINQSSPSYPLHVNASVSGTSIYASADIVAYSDVSVKENIRLIENVIERIQQSRGVLYDRIDIDSKDNIGFIAQELEVAFPELIVTNEDGTKAVKYQNTVAVLFEAIKDQQKQIDELKQIVDGITR